MFAPDDVVIADLCLAADGLLSDHLAGDPLPETGPTPGPGHRARLTLPANVAEQAMAAGALIVADAETVPVVRLSDLVPAAPGDAAAEGAGSATDGSQTVEVLGVATPAEGVATGVGQHLRVSRSPLTTPTAARRVVVLARPALDQDIEEIARSQGDVVLVAAIGSASPDGVPVATMLRLARHAQAGLARRGVNAQLVAATIAWRDQATNQALAAAVAAGLGGEPLLLADAASEPGTAWAHALDWLAHPDARDADLDPVVRSELLRWRPPRAQRGLVTFFTGLSGAGKSTLARGLADRLAEDGSRTLTLLDGDEVRRLLSAGLGFGAEGRDQNVRRIGYVAAEVARHGGVAICAPIAPYERSRAAARSMVEHAGADFVLIHVATTLAECEARDVKGLYARARAGQLTEFTGISDPYEVPESPELRVQTAGRPIEDCVDEVWDYLVAGGWLASAQPVAVKASGGATESVDSTASVDSTDQSQAGTTAGPAE